jgi:hypothetical protein
MAGSKDRTDISPSNIEEYMRRQREETMRQGAQEIKDAEEEYLKHIKMDQHNKIIKQGEIKMSSILPPSNPNVSKSNDLQYLKHYVHLQGNHLQQRIGGIEDTHKKLTRTIEKNSRA